MSQKVPPVDSYVEYKSEDGYMRGAQVIGYLNGYVLLRGRHEYTVVAIEQWRIKLCE